MRIKTGQKMYRVRGPDGLWIQKGENLTLKWIKNEDVATLWRKINHIKKALAKGVLSDGRIDPFLDGLPVAALQVVEYEVKLERTGRKNRLTELDNFTQEVEYVP